MFTETALLPYPSKFTSVSGYRMHYIDEGTGPVVLCLHGNPTWCYYYRNLVAALSKNFRVIAPDMLGMGLSDRTQGVHFKAEDRVKHLAQFISELKLEKFSLVVHDWGGPIGSAYATRNPDKIEKIVYLNTTLTETESLPLIIKWSAAPFIGKILTRHTKSFLRFTTKLGVAKKLPRDVAKRYHAPYKRARDREAIWDFVQDIPFSQEHPTYSTMFNLADGLKNISHKPIKIIWGLQDPCFHQGLLKKVIAHFPDAEVMELPNGSHLVLEDESEVVINSIKEFMERGVNLSQAQNTIDESKVNNHQKINTLYESFCKIAETHPKSMVALTTKEELLSDEVSCKHHSMGELLDSVRQYERGLASLGLSPGDRVLMLVPPGIEFLSLAFAIMGRGGTPVFVDPGVGREKMMLCIRDAAPHAFIGSAKAHLVKCLDRKIFKNMKFSVLAESIFIPGRASLSLLKRFSNKTLPAVSLPSQLNHVGIDTHPAMIAFTSGATGTPKGVVFTNKMLRAQLDIFSSEFGLGQGVIDLPLLGVFTLFNAALGVTSVFTPQKSGKPLAFSPKFMIDVITQFGVKTSFGAPTLWHKIADYCVRVGITLPEVDRVFMAGAPVSQPVLDLVRRVLPNAKLFTPYGATEALPVTLGRLEDLQSVEHSLTGELGICVGYPISGIKVKITPLNVLDNAIEEIPLLNNYHIGEILVSGPSVSPEYLFRPDANSKSKFYDADKNSWHRTGDVGYLDKNNRVYFCGRVADIVYLQDKPLFTYPVEEVFNNYEKVKRVALVATSTNVPTVVVEPHPQYFPEGDLMEKNFADELRKVAECSNITKGLSHFEFIRSLPVDPRHNAKIQRDQLRKWVDSRFNLRRVA